MPTSYRYGILRDVGDAVPYKTIINRQTNNTLHSCKLFFFTIVTQIFL